MNPTAHVWVTCVADQRIHGTTFRKPAEAFAAAPLRSHLGPPPDVLQARIRRTGARDGLVTVETNRYSVAAASVGQNVEVQWGAGETVQIDHRGPLLATHRRAHGHHQRCVEPAHDAMLRRPAPPPGAWQSDEPVCPTSWPAARPAVAGREVAVCEALLGQEGHQA